MAASDNTPALSSGNRRLANIRLPRRAVNRPAGRSVPQDAWWRSLDRARPRWKDKFIARCDVQLERECRVWRMTGLTTDHVPFASPHDVWEMELLRSERWALVAESIVSQLDCRGCIPDIMRARDLGGDRFEVEIYERVRVWRWS